jgi:hypothetical protein
LSPVYIVDNGSILYTNYIVKVVTKALHMNISAKLLDRIEKYRFKRMFPTRSEAIEFLLETALKLNPEKPSDNMSAGKRG